MNDNIFIILQDKEKYRSGREQDDIDREHYVDRQYDQDSGEYFNAMKLTNQA